MAKEVTEEKVLTPEEYGNELVPFYAFKDNGEYKDDIFIQLNGKAYTIKRGVQVMLPRKVAQVYYDSMDQKGKAADYNRARQDEFFARQRYL